METSQIKRKYILDNPVPRKMVGLLLKQDMSPTDLAKIIYGKKNVRSGITKWLDELKKRGWVERVDMGAITNRKQVYRAKLEVLGDFSKKEYEFISVCIERFWNPLTSDLNRSLTDLLLEALIIKKIYKLKHKINHYLPVKDLKFYKENKKKFWRDRDFRNKLLDKIFKKGEKIFGKSNFKSYYIKRDFVFFSLLVPDTLFYKLWGEHRGIGNPLNLAVTLLDEKN